MISIIIPTYNYVCVELVTELHRQLEECGVTYEILVADDASPLQETVVENRVINRLSHTSLIEERENHGRAVVRNRLVERCKYEHILLMDSDMQVCSPTFIADYIAAIGKAPVVMGGIRNVPTCPSPQHTLRFRYEQLADKKRTLENRRRYPYRWFTPQNIMIERSLMQKIGFDANCREYGHEDTILAQELKKRKIEIYHIDNPLIHLGLDVNAIFLDKTETALRTLHSLSRKRQEEIRVSALALRLEQCGMKPICKFIFRCTETLLRKNLLGKTPSILLFQLYKLGYYIQQE